MKHYNELLEAIENVRIGIHHPVSQLGCFNPQCFFQTKPDFLNKLWFADCASLLRLCCNDRQHYSGAQGLDSWVYLIKPSPSLFFLLPSVTCETWAPRRCPSKNANHNSTAPLGLLLLLWVTDWNAEPLLSFLLLSQVFTSKTAYCTRAGKVVMLHSWELLLSSFWKQPVKRKIINCCISYSVWQESSDQVLTQANHGTSWKQFITWSCWCLFQTFVINPISTWVS